MLKTHRVIAVSAAAALTFGGIIGGGIVMAEDPTTTPEPSATTAPGAPKLQQALDDYIAKLAENLGVDEATLRDAINQTNLDFIDQAVVDGKLTEEQAADIRERLEEGTGAFFGLGPLHLPRDHEGRGPLGGIFDREGGGSLNIIGAIGQASEETAAFLGITQDELHTALGEGQSLAQIAEANGKTRDDLKTFLTTRANEEIDAMVASGALTEERASMLKEMLGNNIDRLIDATRPQKGARMFPGFGGGPGSGERHRFDFGPNSDDSSDEGASGPSSFRGGGSSAPDLS